MKKKKKTTEGNPTLLSAIAEGYGRVTGTSSAEPVTVLS